MVTLTNPSLPLGLYSIFSHAFDGGVGRDTPKEWLCDRPSQPNQDRERSPLSPN
ncbi:MAG: hypothetical protein AAGG53_00570 [Cyanobacteria bacterium P01_H01_bin.152]